MNAHAWRRRSGSAHATTELIREFAQPQPPTPHALNKPHLPLPAMNLRAVLLLASTLTTLSSFGRAQTTTTSSSTATNALNTTEQVVVATTQDTCGPRIRKSWDRFTPIEKELYLRAIEQSMDDGLYIKFVEIHTEQMTTAEAHRTCMFIYWHRALLLGFENMLRSYGGDFACITVPYWDYVSHNALFLAGGCTSMEECSPILRELGGSVAGRMRTVDVNGTPVDGRCVAMRPVNHFCEAAGLRGQQCAQCVPRGDWTTERFPGTTSVSSLMRQLFSAPTIGSVATNLEQGIHNTIHSSLGGVMGVLEAPADPIFWSHHATIDLLHSIFYHCAVGNTSPMTLDAKLADPRQFVQCPRRTPLPIRRAIDSNVLFPQSSIMLRSGGVVDPVDSVHDPLNPLAPFFAPLATEYMSYSDIRDLGTYSYNYEMSGLLASMYTTCADVSALLGGGPGMGLGAGAGVGPGALDPRGPVGPVDGAFGGGGFRRLEEQTAQATGGSPFLEAVIVSNKQEAASTETDWYREALRAALNASTNAAAQNPNPDVSSTALALREVEKMTCMFYDECRGNVTDFTPTFRSSFHTNASTPCFTIVSNIKSGRDTMLVTNWKDILLQFLSC